MLMWLHLAVYAVPCNSNLVILKNGPGPGSESLTNVSTVLWDQARRKQEDMSTPPSLVVLSHPVGIGHTCAVRVIFTKTGSHNWNKCVHGHSSE